MCESALCLSCQWGLFATLVHHPIGASISTVGINRFTPFVCAPPHSEFDWGMLDLELAWGMLDYFSVHGQFWGSTCVCILLMGAQLPHSIIILLLVELTFDIHLLVCFHTILEDCPVSLTSQICI